MEQKNRLFISIAVIVLIVIAMFTSFGRSLFMLDGEMAARVYAAPSLVL